MMTLDRNATVFNHTKGGDKETNDRRKGFHHIFTIGSGTDNAVSGEGEDGMLTSQKRTARGVPASIKRRAAKEQDSLERRLAETVKFIGDIRHTFK